MAGSCLATKLRSYSSFTQTVVSTCLDSFFLHSPQFGSSLCLDEQQFAILPHKIFTHSNRQKHFYIVMLILFFGVLFMLGLCFPSYTPTYIKIHRGSLFTTRDSVTFSFSTSSWFRYLHQLRMVMLVACASRRTITANCFLFRLKYLVACLIFINRTQTVVHSNG